MSLIDKTGSRSAVAAASVSGGRRKAKTVARSIPAVNKDSAIAPFKMPRLRPPRFAQRVFDIRDHGAVEREDATAAIAAAIDACAESGGGRVLIPAGNWKSGAIHLRSNI